jgi:hypothetical protein
MKKIFLTLAALVLFVPLAFGAVAINESGTYQGEAVTLDMPGTWITAFDGSTATINPEKQIRFYPQDFMITDGTYIGADGTYATASINTEPGLELDNGILALVWADGETSYAQVTFIVPADYVTGGAFRVICDQSNTLSPVEIDFEVYANAIDDTTPAWNVSHTDETPAGRSDDGVTDDAGSPEQVTLTPTTTIAASDIVTLNLWRSNRSTGTSANATADLEVYYVEFYYSTN